MKTLLAVTVLLVSVQALAQEIGSEIPQPVTPKSSAGQPAPYDNPYGPPPTRTEPKKDEPAPAAAEAKPDEPAGPTGPQLSAGKMSLGLTTGFGGFTAPVAAATGTNPFPSVSSPVPTIGVQFFVIDMLRLSLNLGFAFSSTSQSAMGFAAGLHVDLVLRKPTDSLRPFVTLGGAFGKGFSRASDDFSLAFDLGGGGEYFFSKHFSMNVRALLALPMDLKGGGVGFLITPGLGATVYF